MEYQSLLGRRYILGKQCGRGGEATIFEVVNYSGAIAKLYKPELCNSYREEKLRTMLRLGVPANLEDQIAYPKDILYLNGKFVGFVMRRVNGVLLNEIWEDESLDMEKRCTIAQNMTALLYQINKADFVCGDLNPYNILIDPATGVVRLIDVDSWHIVDNKSGAVFRCDVCVPEYLSPVIAIPKGETLKTAPLPTFSMESDRYSLAILLFQLLMNGTHPFAVGVAKGNTTENVPQPTELMRNYQFPYVQGQCPTGYQSPIYSLPYKCLSYRLQALFQKTFNGENVPIEWFFNALLAYQTEITNTCKKNPIHKYRKGLYSCPYCKANKRKEAFFKAQHQKS